MLSNVAFLSALTVFLFCAWLAGELVFLAPYKGLLFKRHGALLGIVLLVVLFNVGATYYSLARWLFTRDTGRKLSRFDEQLTTSDSPLEDLRARLESEEDGP